MITIKTFPKFILPALLVLTACNPDKIDTKGVKKEMEHYTIKRITPGQIMAEAERKGSEIIDPIQHKINSGLDSALANGKIQDALQFCVTSNYPVIKEMENLYSADIRRAGYSSRLRNPANAPDSLQSMILEGYAYNQEKGLSAFKDVQIQDTKVVFNSPITLNQKTCLHCHGTPGKDLTEEEYKEITSKYPSDKSIHFKSNENIGVWTVIFDKKALIQGIR